MIVRDPELPRELEPVRRLAPGDPDAEINLVGALVEAELPLRARRVRLRECELREVVFEPDEARDGTGGHRLRLTDVVLDGCELSNVDAHEGDLSRVAVSGSRLVGFSLSGGRARDLEVRNTTLQLASFASAGLENVRFEDVDLREASFLRARMKRVEFIGCRLADADFREARLTECAIRGTSLDGVLGVDALRGVRMPWSDVVGSAGALALALGIEIEE